MPLAKLTPLLFALAALLPLSSFADQRHSPEALGAVGRLARQRLAEGATPVVIFDLDDTLIDSRSRTARILAEFAHSPESDGLDPRERELLSDVPTARIAYELADTLAGLGIGSSETTAAAAAFWKQRFFSSDYVRQDAPVRDAPAYAAFLAGIGARLVYLTGRPEETMRAGTAENLETNGFPTDGDQTLLLMKPRAQDDDLEFKKAAFARIAAMGTVVGVFENEPRNINAMHAAFPDAVAVFVDTIHSKRPDEPAPGVAWVRDFSTDERFKSLRLESLAHDAFGF